MQGFRKPTPGLRALSWALALVLLQPWALMGTAYAAYVEETALNLPVDSADSYSFDAADINGDNIDDLIVANRGQSVVLVSNGLGGYADETGARLPASLHTTLDAVFADVDGVNGVDIVMVELITSTFDSVKYFEEGPEPLSRQLHHRCEVTR